MSMTLTQEASDLLALHLVPGLGPRLTSALLARFGSASNALKATREELKEVPHIGEKLASALSQAIARTDLAAELENIARHGVELLIRGESSYPASLTEIPDSPRVLYLKGTLLPRDSRAIALVGSRQCTAYGRRVADQLSKDLVRAGYTVISGLARGIDGVVHRAALEAGGRTLAVLAGGLSKIYPPEHAQLSLEVASAGGLITEAAMKMEPMAQMFPARNRIISRLSLAVVVIEAAEKSGALITATHAGDQGRPVLAVPGPVDSFTSSGTHQLIRKGAVLVRGVDDILEEVEGVRAPKRPDPVTAIPPVLDEIQNRIWQCLADRPRHMDELVQGLAISVSELSGQLVMMEMKRLIRRLPGNQYERR